MGWSDLDMDDKKLAMMSIQINVVQMSAPLMLPVSPLGNQKPRRSNQDIRENIAIDNPSVNGREPCNKSSRKLKDG